MRRFVFFSLALFLLVMPLSVSAQTDFHWTNPGGEKYTGTLEHALYLFGQDDFVPLQARMLLLAKVQQGKSKTETIDENFQAGRMVFGNGKMVSNVVLTTKDLTSSGWQVAPRTVQMYKVRTTYKVTGTGEVRDRIYILYRPEVCGNWSIQVMEILGQCIRDTRVCDEGCRSIHRINEKHSSVGKWGIPAPPPNFFSRADINRLSIKSQKFIKLFTYYAKLAY